jgi:hypothetical protein
MLEARKRGEESYKLLGGRDVDRNLSRLKVDTVTLHGSQGEYTHPRPMTSSTTVTDTGRRFLSSSRFCHRLDPDAASHLRRSG